MFRDKNEIKKKIMRRKPGHSHTNLGCEAAGDSLSSNSTTPAGSLPPHRSQLCCLLPAPASLPSRAHHLGHSRFLLCPLSQSIHPGWRRKSGITGASSIATWEDIVCFLRKHPLLGTNGGCGAPPVISDQSWAQGTADGAPHSSQDSRSHSCTLKGRIFHVPK